jgi:molecular chaperone Hsp33
MTKDRHIRFFVVEAKDTVQEAIDIHHLSITSSVALGRLLIGGLLMGANMKNDDDILTLRIDGDGHLGTLLVTAVHKASDVDEEMSETGTICIKGYVQNPKVELPMSDKGFAVAEAIGKGTLSVIKQLGDSQPYMGQIELVSSEIGEDISYYYQQSEQIDTVVNLGILIDKNAVIMQAGGILIQCMPDTPDDLIALINDNVRRFPNLSDCMDIGFHLEEILEKNIFKGIPIEIFEHKLVKYHCGCDREKFYTGIKMLGEKEIQELIDDGEEVFAECHFCDKRYGFGVDELKEMLNAD